jgi:DNA-binding transcriptional LysR family regulator
VNDTGSFVAAAKKCRTDPSTVSKAITRLEQQLGLILCQRSTRKLTITLAGQQYALTAKKLLDDLSICEGNLSTINDAPKGTLRISAAVCYGHLYLRPMIKAFCQQFPEIKLDIEINDVHTDLIENNIDLAIRTGFVEDSRLVARCLSPMDFLVCAAPEYLKNISPPRQAKDFEEHPWIGFKIKQTQKYQPIFLPDKNGDYALYNLTPAHLTDDGEAMAHMCEDGLGFAQLPHFLAKQGLTTGKLVSLFPSFRAPQPEVGVFAIYPKRTFLPAKVRVLIDFMVEYLKSNGEFVRDTWASNLEPLYSFQNPQ